MSSKIHTTRHTQNTSAHTYVFFLFVVICALVAYSFFSPVYAVLTDNKSTPPDAITATTQENPTETESQYTDTTTESSDEDIEPENQDVAIPTAITPSLFVEDDAILPSVTLDVIQVDDTSSEDDSNAVPNEVIVRYDHKGDLEDDMEQLSQELNVEITIKETIDDLNIALLTTTDISSSDLEKEVRKESSVDTAEPNLKRTGSYIPNDSLFSSQWAHLNTGQNANGVTGTPGADIDSQHAWDIESSSWNTVTVAVIDTGVDYTHADLQGNMWNGAGGCVDDIGSVISGGCPYHGWNYEDGNNNPNDSGHANTQNTGHGTFVASMIAARSNNGTGVTGISRYNKVNVMALRFNFDVFTEIRAINFAARNGAKVINASFGGSGYSALEESTINAFPGVFVTAAGNGGTDLIGDNNDVNGFYPCAYANSNIICVAASNQNDQLASFSNYGTTSVDIAAPGVNLRGIYRGSYLYGNGTSFSSPLVAGVAALLYSANPALTPQTVIADIKNSGQYVPSFSGKIGSQRRLHALNATKLVYGSDSGTVFGTTAIYRLYNTQSGVHLYTKGTADRDKILAKYPAFEYTDGSAAFYTFLASQAGTTPIYRLYNKKSGVHLYTRGTADRDKILAKFPDFEFTDGGPAFYAYLTEQPGTTGIYRLFNTQLGVHLYTRGTADRDKILAKYPVFEFTDGGPAFYAYLN